VVFAVAGGGGQITLATAQTNASGIATAGTWTLGRAAGPQTLTATLMDDNATSILFGGGTAGTLTASDVAGNPVVFTATGNPGPAAKLALSVANVLRNRIAFDAFLEVTDTYGNHVNLAGVAISASISGSGATLQGTTSRSTDANGNVTFSRLAVAGTAGARTITFSSASFANAASPFDLIGGLPTKIAVDAGDSQSATQLTTLSTLPSVKVTDVDNNSVPDAKVAFTVTGGGGQVTETSNFTNSAGVAATTWTLGYSVGQQLLSASVVADASLTPVTFTGSTTGTLTTPSVAGNPVVFAATATDRTICGTTPALTVGGTAVSSSLNRATSCLRNVSGTHLPMEAYSITTASSQTNFALTMTSSTVTPRIVNFMWSPLGASYYNDGPSPYSQYYFVKAGTYQVWATTNTVSNGSYTLATALNPAIPTGCLYGIVTAGVTLNHSMDTGCNYTLNNTLTGSSKRYILAVPANTALTITMSSSAFDPYLELYQISGTSRIFVAADDNGLPPTGARIALTGVSANRLYEIRATNAGNIAATGAYTLTIAP
jgi:hypothetical protein